MKFSFIIPTCAGSESKIKNVLESIYAQKIPPQDYEIIIVGNYQPPELKFKIEDVEFVDLRAEDGSLLKVISFEEGKSGIPKHITLKKNIGVAASRFDTLCVLHDYVCPEPGFYEGMLEFGDNFDVMSCPMSYEDGHRAIDHVLMPFNYIPNNKLKAFIDSKIKVAGNALILPYDLAANGELSEYVYQPGNLIICKRKWLVEYPQNIRKSWDSGEDLEWSNIATKAGAKIKLNMNSRFRFKSGGRPCGHSFVNQEMANIIKEFIEKEGLK